MKKITIIALIAVACLSASTQYIANPNGYSISIDDIQIELNDNNYQNDFCNPILNRQKGFSNSITNETGLPQIPSYKRFIRIPEDGEIEIRYSTGDRTTIDLNKKGYSSGIMPHQPSWRKDLPQPAFVIDENFYHQNSDYPDNLVSVEKAGRIRGKKIAVLTINPVQYNPANNQLKFVDAIDIYIEFSQPIEQLEPRLASKAFENGIFNMILEPTEIEPIVTPPAVYLIITHSSFTTYLDDFRGALSRWGYDVRIATTAETGTTPEDITAYIEDAYESWDVAPSFVLFVGDYDVVAPYDVEGSSPWSSGHPSDLYHFTLDGDDYFQDIMYGRMSVSMPFELTRLLNKSMVHYENNFADEAAFLRIGFGACGDDGRYEVAMGTHRYAIDSYLHAPDFEPDSVYAIYGAGTTELTDMIENGVFLFNYSGHGSVTSFANPEFTFEDITALENETYPLVIGNCCVTGKFDEECFAEAMTNDEHAASSYIGASNNTYWDEDDIWERRLYDGIFEEDFAYLASFMYKGNLEVYLWDDESAEYYFEIYHSFGDPAMTFYFGEPDTIDVELIGYDFITSGLSEYTFFPSVSGAWVSLSVGDSLYGADVTEAGMATVPISPIFEFPDTVTLIAHRPNFWKPFIVDIPTAPPAEIAVEPDSIPVGIESEITIFIESDSEPVEGAEVIISGYSVAGTLMTDSEGIAAASITSPYIQILEITATDIEGIPLGRKNLTVFGSADWETSIFASTPAISLIDSIAIGLESNVELSATPGDFTVILDQPGGFSMTLETDESSITTNPVPEVQNDIDVAFLKEGYPIHHDIINVCRPMTYPSVTVSEEGGGPIEGALVEIFEVDADTLSDDPVISGATNSDGSYIGDGLIDCKFYIIQANAFGFMPNTITSPMPPDASINIELERGATAMVSGNIGISKVGRVTLIDQESFEIMDETLTDADGDYSFIEVPFHDYKIVASSRGYTRHVGELTISSTDITYDPIIEPANPPVLIIDNSDGGSGATRMSGDILDYYGYIPSVVSDFDLDMLFDYEIVIYSSGEAESPLDVDELQILLEYHKLGGNIIIEGGEIGYQVTDLSDMTLSHKLFHCSGWETDNPRGVTAVSGADFTKSPLVDPAYLEEEMAFASAGMWDYYMYDVLTPMDDAELLYESDVREGSGVVIKFDDAENDGFKTILIYAFDYITGFDDEDDAKKFILNGIEYVREPDWGSGKIFGQVILEDRDDYSGVSISSGADEATSWQDGRFVVHADAGEVELTFSHDDFTDTTISTEVLPDSETWGIIVRMMMEAVHEQKPFPNKLKIVGPYPNPANASFAISIDSEIKDYAQIELYDIDGKLALQKTIENSNEIVNCENLESGIYLYRLQIDNKHKKGKFVLMK